MRRDAVNELMCPVFLRCGNRLRDAFDPMQTWLRMPVAAQHSLAPHSLRTNMVCTATQLQWRYRMKRRGVIVLLGGLASLPQIAFAQSTDRMRLMGWLAPLEPNDPLGLKVRAAFDKQIRDLRW